MVIEDLNVKNMSRSAKVDMENPGKNVKAKSGLNREILNKAWGQLATQLEYKLDKKGGKLIKVNPSYTSQKCSRCHHVDPKNRKSQDKFECLACGHAENADINAAKNILQLGLEQDI